MAHFFLKKRNHSEPFLNVSLHSKIGNFNDRLGHNIFQIFILPKDDKTILPTFILMGRHWPLFVYFRSFQ